MERIFLYYPTIEIPQNDWLFQAILYSDKVSSILPFTEDKWLPETVKYLHWKGEYKPIFIEEIIQNNKKEFNIFENQFFKTVDDQSFLSFSSNTPRDERFRGIYYNKMTRSIMYELEKRNLIQNRTNEKIFVHENVAIYYMSVLAKFVASLDNENLVVPSTDYKRFSDLSFEHLNKTQIAYNLIFDKCLPSPHESVEIRKIIEFKKNHKNDLLRFRKFISEIIEKIKNASDDYDVKEYICSAKEKIEYEIEELDNLFKKNKIKTVIKGINTLIGLDNPKLFNSLLQAGIITTVINPKIGIGMVGIGIIGKLIDNQFLKPSYSHELNYLFEAKKIGIIK